MKLNKEEICIRRLAPEEALKAAELEAECFSMPWSSAAFEKLAGGKGSICLAVFLKEQLIGCCSVMNLAGDGEINNVAVREAYRGQGIASAMLLELVRQGEEMGITDFTLEVRKGNAAAIHLYEKAGFRSEGIRPGFYDKPKEDAVIMWRRRSQ